MTNPLNASHSEPRFSTEEIVEQYSQLTYTEIRECIQLYDGTYSGSDITILYNNRVPFGLAVAVSLGGSENSTAMEIFVSMSPMQKERLFSPDKGMKALVTKQLLDSLVSQRDSFKEAAYDIESIRTVAISTEEASELRGLGVHIVDESGVDVDLDDDGEDDDDSTRTTH